MADYTPPILAIIGPTATGKTPLGLQLAKQFNGEIVSADSRQVYKSMDIATGKDLPKAAKFNLIYTRENLDYGFYDFEGVKVWGLDIVLANYPFNVNDWVTYATNIICEIQNRGKVPIIVGGTGQYVYSYFNPPQTIAVPVNAKLRQDLDLLTVEQLQEKLKEIAPEKFSSMNNSDRFNPRRLVRAIEVAVSGMDLDNKNESKRIERLVVGLKADQQTINSKIDRRVDARLDLGVVLEIENLLKHGVSWEMQSMSVIGYREFRPYFDDLETLEQVCNNWKISEHQYAKKQLRYQEKYFPEAKWFDVQNKFWEKEVFELVAQALKCPAD